MMNALSPLLVTAALSAVMLLVLSSLARSTDSGIRPWSWANWLAVVALPLFASRGILPDILSVELANALYMAAITLMFVGFRRHLARPVPVRLLAACAALAYGALVFFHFAADSFLLRVVAMSFFHGVVTLLLGLSVRGALDRAPARYPYVFTSVAAIALACGHAVRALVSAGQAAGITVVFDVPTWNLIFISIGTLTMPLLTLGAVMMANAEINARATYAADHDHLTGAWSRRAFFNVANHEIARAERSGSELSVLLFDVDHFKRINDRHGHAVGDQVLVDIVRRTGHAMRKVDCCARLGGEEFAVLLPDAGLATAAVAAERLREALAAPGVDLQVNCTVSIGIARREPGESIAGVLCRADRALYQAKSSGRNMVVFARAGDVEGAPQPPVTLAVSQALAADEQF